MYPMRLGKVILLVLFIGSVISMAVDRHRGVKPKGLFRRNMVNNKPIRIRKRAAVCKSKSSSKVVSSTSSDWSDQFTQDPSHETTT